MKFCPSCGAAVEEPTSTSGNSNPSSPPDDKWDIHDTRRASHREVSSGIGAESVPSPAGDTEPPVSVAASRRASGRAFAYLVPVVMAAFGVWFYFTPHIAVNNLKSAVQAQDAARLSQYIDYPPLRESLKRALTAKIVGQTSGKNADPFAALEASMAAAMINPAVDKLMTPEGLAILITGGNGPSGKGKKKLSDLEAEADIGMAYESFNRFVVTLSEKGKKDGESIGLVFGRVGLLSWRLGEVRM